MQLPYTQLKSLESAENPVSNMDDNMWLELLYQSGRTACRHRLRIVLLLQTFLLYNIIQKNESK